MQASAIKPEHHIVSPRSLKTTTHSSPDVAVATTKTTTHIGKEMASPVAANRPSNSPVATEPHSANGPHAPTANVAKAVAAETRHGKEETNNHLGAPRSPVYIREKEGRVIYSGKGFRVQIYSGGDREKAIMVKTEFMRRYPSVRTYLTYVSPSFRVKVGNYRNRSDAMGMYKEARTMYSPCVIVPDIITINTY